MMCVAAGDCMSLLHCFIMLCVSISVLQHDDGDDDYWHSTANTMNVCSQHIHCSSSCMYIVRDRMTACCNPGHIWFSIFNPLSLSLFAAGGRKVQRLQFYHW